jgi:hypothetical protein
MKATVKPVMTVSTASVIATFLVRYVARNPTMPENTPPRNTPKAGKPRSAGKGII